jgi:hypothetical protein
MKKYIAMLLALMMVLCLTACGEEEPAGEQQITLGAEVTEATKGADATEAPEQGGEIVPGGAVFCFNYEGVDIIPGEAFDASVLPEAASVYEVPSCALVGTDNLYNYETFEVTAFNEGNGEFVYSIYFIDPNLTTNEGLALGDGMDKVVELYGEGYENLDGELVYTNMNTQLRLIVENDVVVSIEFRMVTEN